MAPGSGLEAMILLGIAMLVLAVDQTSKFMVLHQLQLNETVPLLFNTVFLTYKQNPGAAFGFMSEMEPMARIPLFVAVTLAAFAIVYTYQHFLPPEKHLPRVGLGLVLGGVLGNFLDRLLYGRVIDFIDLRWEELQWWVFNLADTCVLVGLLILLVTYLNGRKEKATEPG
jgi:signal peptidase II